jgi:hypothetical protein
MTPALLIVRVCQVRAEWCHKVGKKLQADMSGRHEERFLAAATQLGAQLDNADVKRFTTVPHTDSPVAIALQPEGTRALSQLQRRLKSVSAFASATRLSGHVMTPPCTLRFSSFKRSPPQKAGGNSWQKRFTIARFFAFLQLTHTHTHIHTRCTTSHLNMKKAKMKGKER